MLSILTSHPYFIPPSRNTIAHISQETLSWGRQLTVSSLSNSWSEVFQYRKLTISGFLFCLGYDHVCTVHLRPWHVQTVTHSSVRRDVSSTSLCLLSQQVSSSRQKWTGCKRRITQEAAKPLDCFVVFVLLKISAPNKPLKNIARSYLFPPFFCLIPSSFHSTVIFADFQRLALEGGGDNNDKHTSWQTCVCANRKLEGCLNTLTKKKKKIKLKAFFIVFLSACICETFKRRRRKKKKHKQQVVCCPFPHCPPIIVSSLSEPGTQPTVQQYCGYGW